MENKEANPKCPTCGGSKKICPNCGGSQNTCGCDEQTITTTKTRWIPCPDCEEMPESQEPETQEGYGYCSKCQSFTPHHKGQCYGDKCKESQGSGMTVFIATSWGAHNTDIHGVFTEEKLGEAFLAQAGLEDIIGCGVTEWEVQTSQEPIPQGWEKEMGENLEKYGKVYNPNESDEPEGQESGLAESDYMSIEQREKFEAGHVPEKVEASELAKRARRAIADIVVAAPDDEQAVKEAMKILYKACDRLEAAEEENITTKEIARAEVKDLQEEIKQLKAKLEALKE